MRIRKTTRLLAVLLTVCIIFQMIPSVTPKASAASAVVLEEGDLLYYGGMKWIVLSTDAVANDSTGKTGVLLLAENAVASMNMYDNVGDYVSSGDLWNNCKARNYLMNNFENTLDMSDTEKAAVITAVKNDFVLNDSVSIYEPGLLGDRFFLLSRREIIKYLPNSEERGCTYKGDACYWWTRDFSKPDNYSGALGKVVNPEGQINDSDAKIAVINKLSVTVRPAFYLDMEQVESVVSNGNFKSLVFKDGTRTLNTIIAPGIVYDLSFLKDGANNEDAPVIYLGGMPWYTIGYNGSGNEYAATAGAITLFLTEPTGTTQFKNSFSSAEYFNSTLKVRLDDWKYGGQNAKVTEAEQLAIMPRTLLGGAQNLVDDNAIALYGNLVMGDTVENAVFWPLSYSEALVLNNKLKTPGITVWLRSPGTRDKRAYAMEGNQFYSLPTEDEYIERYIQPACNLNLDSIEFLSQAVGGKQSGTGADALVPVEENTTGEWKITIKDNNSYSDELSGHAGFYIDNETNDCEGKTVTFDYGGAQYGENEYLSAMVVHYKTVYEYDFGGHAHEYRKLDSVVSYGRIKKIETGEDTYGTATLNVEGKIGENDVLYIFNEQYNGDKKTDYCSTVYQIAYEPTGHDWEFSGFEWTGNAVDGYENAEAVYVCKNDPTHTESVAVDFTSLAYPATCTKDGKTVFTAKIDAEYSLDGKAHIENKDAIPVPAFGHSWHFSKFTWEGDAENGYTSALGEYYCENDGTHWVAAELMLTPTVINPKCEEGGVTEYTAYIPASNSLDGYEHSETKTAFATDPTDHDWEFVDFTWIGNDTDGYTGAVANYVCKNDATHTKGVEVELDSAVTDPTCETDGKTEYTALISAGDSADKKEHTETRDAEITSALGHKWGEWTVVTEATDVSEGSEQRVCENDDTHVETRSIPALGYEYTVTNAVTDYTQGGTETIGFVINRSYDNEGAFAHFKGVKCDDKELKEGVDYTAESGSIIVVVNPEFLDSLEAGTHTVSVMLDDYDDINVSVSVKAATETKLNDVPAPDNSKADATPKTGDDAGVNVVIVMMAFSLAGAAALFVKKSRRQ
ncbi:MAG: DUF6273 domain-containing protein [Lachnospiraceae bacterium]|nr:DUF6273 domain-containing protein [Lachnospiraceae bacterium]